MPNFSVLRNSQIRSAAIVILLILNFSWPVILRAQQFGELHGVITDQASGEPLVGVNIILVGTSIGAATDIDGKYTIRRIPPNAYDVRISDVGYATKVVTNVLINADRVAELSTALTEESNNLKEVVVTAEEIKSSESSVLSSRKKAISISDGISAEQIKKTPDATSSDALKRITGVSIVDNKFVYVRGITDRYNETTLDGATVSSTEAGRKSFSFDLIPANLLENTSVVKSGSPDLPGNFSGGLVQLNTLDFPSGFASKLSVASAYNSVSTSKLISLSQGGSKDWLGIDDGSRSYPGDYPTGNEIAQKAPNNWAPRGKNAPANNSLSLSLGDRFMFDSDDATGSQLGFISALSYKSNYLHNDQTIDDFELDRKLAGGTDEYSVLWGVIANASVKINGLNKISFKNSYDQSGSDQVRNFQGPDGNNGLENKYTTINWTQRSSYTGQLVGEHNFPMLGGTILQWRGAISTSHRSDPDRKEVNYYQAIDDPSVPFGAATNRRSWASLDNRSENIGLDLTIPVGTSKVKFGSFYETKTSSYTIRTFNVVGKYPGVDSLQYLPLEYIYQQDHFGTKLFNFTEATDPTDRYDGDEKLFSAFAMLDVPFSVSDLQFRLSGGARLENDEMNINVPKTNIPDGPVVRTQHKNADVLPSANFTYLVTDKMNFRLAYYHSVNRPEFREIASTSHFYFINYELQAGNPDLQRAFIHNYDARLEYFPEPGEVLAVSWFRKVISDAIEEQLLPSATRTRVYFNSGSASNTGWEFEFRKSLRFIGSYFGNFVLGGNYTRVTSEVQVVSTTGNSSNTTVVVYTRPLAGQSPYMINLSFTFTEPNIGTSVSLLYNTFGRRLQTIGFQAGDIYEEPRDVVDFVVTQEAFGNLELKFAVRNLNDKDRILTRSDRLLMTSTMGRNVELKLSWSL